MKKALILENIRSVYNVGAIFRTADAIGIDKIYLIGYTPQPIDRFGRKRDDLHKAALGAEDNVEWESVKDSEDVVKKLKEDGYKIISLEQSDNSTDYKEVDIDSDTAIVLGNEVEGVSKEILELSDVIAEIPMFGSKESLNVSVATAVLLFRFFDK